MPDLSLRHLTRSDFPLLRRWLATPLVARWWNHETTPEALEADFGPTIDGRDPADVFIAEVEGRPFGLIQRYRFADNPGYIDELAPLIEVPPAALSIDYFVGEPALLRRGLGAAMIRRCVDDIWRDHPAAPSVVVPVVAANTASWRVLEGCGFRRVAEGPLTPDNPIDDPAHFVYEMRRDL